MYVVFFYNILNIPSSAIIYESAIIRADKKTVYLEVSSGEKKIIHHIIFDLTE